MGRRAIVICTLLSLSLAASGRAHADSITIPDAVDFADAFGFSIAGDRVRVSGTFEPFDSSLGTLSSASFHILAGGSAFRTIGPIDPGVYGSNLLGEMSLIGPDDSVLYSEEYGVTAFPCCIEMDPYGEPSNFGTGVPYELRLSDGNSAVFSRTITVDTGLDHFLTGGPFTVQNRFFFDFRTAEGSGPPYSLPPPGTIYAADTITGYLAVPHANDPIGSVDLTYEYAPVPEPGTAYLVGAGLILMATSASRVRH